MKRGKNLKNIHQIKVYFGNTDAAGIVFYPNFYEWMDQASAEFLGKAILPTSRLFKEKNILLPLLETFCEFHSPLFFEDVVEIHSEVTEINDKTFKLVHEFKREGKTVAKGYEIKAWTTKIDGTLKAIPIPNEVRRLLDFEVVKD